MGDAESDEHLRIFKCLVDTGSDVLRYTVERKMLINTSFEQYLNQNKHKFYHQFEKRRYKPCCPGNPHNCVVNGKMDKKIFFKMYQKKTELDTQDCLDRFEVNADITLDKLDLSDLNFFLWNSATLSTQEEQSLQAIMSTRSEICHSSSSRKYSLNELENFWLSLKNDLLLFAEPYHYKKSIEREITTLSNCSLSKTESKKVIEKMKNIFHELKLESEAHNKSIENLVKEETDELKNCIRLENNTTKTHINEKVQELLDSERTVCKKVKSNKRRMDEMLELTQEGMKQNSKGLKTMKTQQTEYNKKHQQTTIKCKDEIEAKVKGEGRKTRLHNEGQNKSFDKKLTETEMRVCQTVAQSHRQLTIKMEEEAIDTRRHTDKRLISLEAQLEKFIGLLGKQTVYARTNQEHIEESTEKSDAQDIYITSKLDQQCLTADKERNVIKNLQSEIQIPPSNDTNLDTLEKQAFKVIVKKVNSIILKMKATPGIFKSVETLKSALLTLVKNVQIAGKIDVEIEDTVTVDLSFNSPLTKDQIAVVKCLFSKEWNDDNSDKQLSKEHSSSGVANFESHSDHETSSHQAVTRPLCQACAEKDKQIKAYEEYEEKTQEHEKSKEVYKLQEKSESIYDPSEGMIKKIQLIEDRKAKMQENQKIASKYKLQDACSTTYPYDCRNCFEKDEIIIQLDRRLCQIRRHLVKIKENQLSEKTLLEGDLVKLITLATNTIYADESTRIAEKETKSNIYSLISDKMAVYSDVHHNRTKTLREDIDIQSGEGSLDKLYHSSEKSDVSSRLLEIKREYARNFYTKTAEQKGLALIFRNDRRRCFHHRDDHDAIHLEDFFEEKGFIVKRTEESDHSKLLKYMTDEQSYCVFIVLLGHHAFGDDKDSFPILHLLLLRLKGKPVIVMTDCNFDFFHIRENIEGNEILIVMPTRQGSTGSYMNRHLGYKNIFDDFIKFTRSNRFADIIDILTRINSLYDYPVITFQSTLRKKLSFL